ncbi:hypothetical protein SPAN111604_00520 [Sphingomonas antarctica]|uniref:hypothetical protein n=1 Tax=Sphingomonas antarctica TaxID=2040274 RepID=UPI0039EB9D3E
MDEQTGPSVADKVTEVLDSAVDKATHVIAGDDGNKLIGGAAVGAVAGILLPFSVGFGILLGAGYAAYRQLKK